MTGINALVEAVVRVKALHHAEETFEGVVCAECMDKQSSIPERVLFPCATIKAIQAAEIEFGVDFSVEYLGGPVKVTIALSADQYAELREGAEDVSMETWNDYCVERLLQPMALPPVDEETDNDLLTRSLDNYDRVHCYWCHLTDHEPIILIGEKYVHIECVERIEWALRMRQ